MSKRAIVILAMWVAVVGIVAGRAEAQSATPPGERFVLTGLVYGEGGRGLAWLQEPTFTNNQVVAVRLGDSIGPYRLTKIFENQVELEGPGGRVSVPLAGTGGATSVAALPGAAQPPQEPEAPPHTALSNPKAIVVPRGDPSRNFPAAILLSGGGNVSRH